MSENWRPVEETRELKFAVDLSPSDHILRHGVRALKIGYVVVRYEWATGDRWTRKSVQCLEHGAGFDLACVRWPDIRTVPAWLQAIVDRADREAQDAR